MTAVIGWDIGGVNTKVARVDDGRVSAAISEPFEIQHRLPELPRFLADLAKRISMDGAGEDTPHAVTMTAELSQRFRTKREGVSSILHGVTEALPAHCVRVYAVDGRFLTPDEARRSPLAVAASNWAATARIVARTHPDALLIDIGTTTTDIVPIVNGEVAALGFTDPERLRANELLYIGVVRTPVEAIVHDVPYRGGWAGVSAEAFALAADVHLWRDALDPTDYSVPTPDGRPVTREFVRERLARIICTDREDVTDEEISAIAEHVADATLTRIATCIARVLDRHPRIRAAVTTGLGEALAAHAARRLGLHVTSLAEHLGAPAARLAPAAAVALLLSQLESVRGTS